MTRAPSRWDRSTWRSRQPSAENCSSHDPAGRSAVKPSRNRSASEAATVIQGWADYLRTAPDELTSTADFANPFRGPEAPVEIHVAFDGDDPELAARAIDPIRRLGTVTGDDIALQPYADTLADGPPPPPGLQFTLRSAFAGQESVPEVLRILAEVRAS